MKRGENPRAGYLSTLLLNQKKRNRIPLTVAPSENEFFSHSEYMASTSSDTSHSPSGTFGCYQASGPSSGASQSHLWNRQGIPPSTPPQQYGSNRPAPGPAPAIRNYAPMPHPYKAEGTRSKMGQSSNQLRQQEPSTSVNARQREYQAPRISESAPSKPTPHTGFSQMGQQSFYRPPNPTYQYSQQSRPLLAPAPPPSRPSACAAQPQNNSWKFTNTFGPQKPLFEGTWSRDQPQTKQQTQTQYSQQSRPLPPPAPPPSRPSAHAVQPQNNSWKFTNTFGPQKPLFEGNRSKNQPQTKQQTQTQETFPKKPAIRNSLRILTAVIDGMRHWSQFKDKVPCLFEIFASLDSAVTLGRHGAKNFLMSEGKEVVQCVFYENEQELRLIRGQVYRCVGNYDRSRDFLMCVSIRPGLRSEMRNAQLAVKACNAEMRVLVKSLNEV